MQEILDRESGCFYRGFQSEIFVEISVLPLPLLAAPDDNISLSILDLEGIFVNWGCLF
jgi:hypothetical protein